MQRTNHTSLSTLRRRTGRLSAVACAVVLLATAAGCRSEMYDTGRIKPMELSTFFPDSQAARPLIPGTVARGMLRIDEQYYTGKAPAGSVQPRPAVATPTADTGAASTSSATTAATTAGMNGATTFPFAITKQVLQRGQDRYNIYCAPCHARSGDGRGMIVQRGLQQPPSFHTDQLRTAPPGHVYDVITNGFGAMYSYASRIQPSDRWAIAAYIRALQLSRNATVNDLTAEERQKLETTNR